MRVEDEIRRELGVRLGMSEWDIASETRWRRVDGELVLEVSGRVWVGVGGLTKDAAEALGVKSPRSFDKLYYCGYPLALTPLDDLDPGGGRTLDRAGMPLTFKGHPVVWVDAPMEHVNTPPEEEDAT